MEIPQADLFDTKKKERKLNQAPKVLVNFSMLPVLDTCMVTFYIENPAFLQNHWQVRWYWTVIMARKMRIWSCNYSDNLQSKPSGSLECYTRRCKDHFSPKLWWENVPCRARKFLQIWPNISSFRKSPSLNVSLPCIIIYLCISFAYCNWAGARWQWLYTCSQT